MMTAAGFISTDGNPSWPNIGLFQIANGVGQGSPSMFTFTKNVRRDIMQKYLKNVIGMDAVYVAINQELPKSRGSITLRSNDPFDHPIIEPNCFSHPDDIEVMVKGD